MLQVNLEELEAAQNGWKTQPKITEVDLSQYENGDLLRLINQKGNNLKFRHANDTPYTRTGDIIISLNPYQWLQELNTQNQRNTFAQKLIWETAGRDPRGEMDPHVYETAALSYKGIAIDGNNQSILVSGESGAGKTV